MKTLEGIHNTDIIDVHKLSRSQVLSIECLQTVSIIVSFNILCNYQKFIIIMRLTIYKLVAT